MDAVEHFILSGLELGRFHYSGKRDYEENIFQKFLVVDIKDNSSDIINVEIPAFLGGLVQYGTKFVIPLFCNSPITPRRLVRNMLRDFESSASRGLLNGIITTNNIKYYGFPGVIFDENMDILMIVTTEVTLNKANNNSIINRCVCRVSPKVFNNPNGTLEKMIIKKVIPSCYNIRPRHTMGNRRIDEAKPIKVIIDDCSYFIESPIVPNVENFTQEKVDAFIRNNIDEFTGIF